MEEKYSNYTVKDLTEPSSPLEKFAKKVLDKLIEEGIPPIPSNYALYFFNMLEDEDKEFKKQVYELISLEDSDDLDKNLELEKKLKLSFKYSKEILQRTALMYKLTAQLKKILQDSIAQMSHLASPKTLEKYLKNIDAKIGKISKSLDNELKEIKELYSKNVEIIKEIESNTTFDMVYGVYNAKYFKKLLEKEIKLIEKFSHKSSLITLKVSDKILKEFKLQKSATIVNRSVAKILLKTSRRTDVIAHLGNGIFAMLLKHTDIVGAQKTIERVSEIISNSAIFIEGNEIEIKIVGAICDLKPGINIDEYFKTCIEALKKAEEENKLYIIVEGE